MRVLVDANLSPQVAERLKQAGHDAVHVSEMDLTTADDETILSRAFDAGQVVVTAGDRCLYTPRVVACSIGRCPTRNAST